MSRIKRGLIVILAALASLTVLAPLAADENEVIKKLQTEGYAITVHLRSIPAEYREKAKATNHLSIMVMSPKGDEVTNATVSYAFVQQGKSVAKGGLPYMAGTPMPGMDHHKMNSGLSGMRMDNCMQMQNEHMNMKGKGHYGADLTLPGPGKYTLNLTIKVENKVFKASTEIATK